MNSKNFDPNLLLVFDAVFPEGGISRAGGIKGVRVIYFALTCLHASAAAHAD